MCWDKVTIGYILFVNLVGGEDNFMGDADTGEAKALVD
jgi:hypothetical protein